MENTTTKKNQEENALAPIPMSERRGWISVAFVQAGICVCVPAFLLGALLAEGMPFWPAVISGSLGYIIAIAGMCITGIIGSDLGLASCALTTSAFGTKGAKYIVSLLFGINMIGWFGIQNGICGEAFANFLTEYVGINVSVTLCSVVWGIIMLITAVYGMSALEKLDYVAIPFLMLIMLYGTYLAIQQYGLVQMQNEVTQTMSFMAGVSLSFNFYAVGTITSADFTRFQRSRKETVAATVWGVLPMGIITLIIGIVLTRIANEYDISMVLINVGIPVLGLLSLILSTWTTNSTNAYCAGINFVMALNIPDNKRKQATIAVGLVGTFLGAMGILDHVEGVLSLLSFLVCPIGGIIIADYWVIGKGKPENWHNIEGFNKMSCFTWIISGILSYLCGIEYLGILISFVIYLILEKFYPSKARISGPLTQAE